MADDWEDWEADDYEPQLPGAAGNGADAEVTKGAKLLSDEPDASKFAGEDEEEDAPRWQGSVPGTQKKKEVTSKYDESRGVVQDDDTPLDDPVAEKLRKQRLIEEADYAATKELFGGAAAAADLDGMLPKSAKDFEQFAEALAAKYVLQHHKSPHYKLLLKQLVKHVLQPLSVQETKDVETSIAGIRSDKLKAEQAAKAAAAKGKQKKQINVGKSGGSAGLDDYQYDNADEDEFDFM